ncbi:MAG TPA: hypothetical protein H9973_10595, partial [Candidatus Alistipes cottocaccae]|nr:hypothetical protein [Candidatus Alistipes cottocaccae]
GTGGCKGLILLHPFSEEFRGFPQKATCGWFWVPFDTKRYRLKKPVLRAAEPVKGFRIVNPPG